MDTSHEETTSLELSQTEIKTLKSAKKEFEPLLEETNKWLSQLATFEELWRLKDDNNALSESIALSEHLEQHAREAAYLERERQHIANENARMAQEEKSLQDSIETMRRLLAEREMYFAQSSTVSRSSSASILLIISVLAVLFAVVLFADAYMKRIGLERPSFAFV